MPTVGHDHDDHDIFTVRDKAGGIQGYYRYSEPETTTNIVTQTASLVEVSTAPLPVVNPSLSLPQFTRRRCPLPTIPQTLLDTCPTYGSRTYSRNIDELPSPPVSIAPWAEEPSQSESTKVTYFTTDTGLITTPTTLMTPTEGSSNAPGPRQNMPPLTLLVILVLVFFAARFIYWLLGSFHAMAEVQRTGNGEAWENVKVWLLDHVSKKKKGSDATMRRQMELWLEFVNGRVTAMMYKSHLLVIYHDIHHKSWRVKLFGFQPHATLRQLLADSMLPKEIEELDALSRQVSPEVLPGVDDKSATPTPNTPKASDTMPPQDEPNANEMTASSAAESRVAPGDGNDAEDADVAVVGGEAEGATEAVGF